MQVALSRCAPSGAARGLRLLLGAALVGALAWLVVPVIAAEPISGFSRQPVASWRSLTSAERARLEAWNQSHPTAALDPARVSSLELHFLKHAAGGREFLTHGVFRAAPRFPTARAYEEAARALAAGRADGHNIRRFRRSDGATVTVETTSGAVVIAAPTGRLKTFFNAAARCSGREPIVRCSTSLARSARWVRGRLRSGRLIEIDYASDPLAHPQPLRSPPPRSHAPSAP